VNLGGGLAAGLALSVLLRALGSGNDVSTFGPTQAIGGLLTAVGAVLIVVVWGPGADVAPEEGGQRRGSWWGTAGLALGVVSALALLYFSFSAPNVIARWTGANYLVIMAAVALVLAAFAALLSVRPKLLAKLTPGAILVWNLLFVVALTLTIVAHQVAFPADRAGYPLAEPPVTFLHHVPLFFTLLLFPVILVDLILLSQELTDRRPSPRSLGSAFALAGLYLLLLIFANIFTTVYAYVPGGPFFRDRYWLAYLVPGIVLTLSILMTRRVSLEVVLAAAPTPVYGGVVLLIALGAILGVILTAANPSGPAAGARTLRVLTYNIQQGYKREPVKDQPGVEEPVLNYDGQLALIEEQAPDIVGLQESDNARVAGANGDVVRYMADRLDMHSYYGPKTVPGTFGIALLSRYPIENPRTFYMFSEGEQTATIAAQITVDGVTWNVFVTHLGNDGPIVQQEDILSQVAGLQNVILMGDHNFRPDTGQYRLTTEMLVDSWVEAGVGTEVDDRIDHIFLSPGTQVVETRYLTDPQSDHPAMVTDITW
jgi:endonuclease/exonuclease/phosphatase family metal-dependent hydrolase